MDGDCCLDLYAGVLLAESGIIVSWPSGGALCHRGLKASMPPSAIFGACGEVCLLGVRGMRGSCRLGLLVVLGPSWLWWRVNARLCGVVRRSALGLNGLGG